MCPRACVSIFVATRARVRARSAVGRHVGTVRDACAAMGAPLCGGHSVLRGHGPPAAPAATPPPPRTLARRRTHARRAGVGPRHILWRLRRRTRARRPLPRRRRWRPRCRRRGAAALAARAPAARRAVCCTPPPPPVVFAPCLVHRPHHEEPHTRSLHHTLPLRRTAALRAVSTHGRRAASVAHIPHRRTPHRIGVKWN